VTRATIVIKRQSDRAKAARWAGGVPDGTEITFKSPGRSTDQNAALWSWLTEISRRKDWHGQRLSPEEWKDVFSASYRRELRMVPNLNGDGFVLLGMRTSTMTKSELSELLELIAAFAASHGIDLPQAA
jgi:hypothetical protein